jgi:hypothetical protein
MAKSTVGNESSRSRVVTTLRELISALDRRVPHAERPGEIGIARDAAKLRREAVAQIDSLTRARVDDRVFDQELAEAMMTDDGGPAESETNTPLVRPRSEG